MNAETKLIFELMRAFEGIDSSLRRFGISSANVSTWRPIGEKEKTAFEALVALENRTALKKWYSASSSINPSANVFRRILEHAIGEELPLGK